MSSFIILAQSKVAADVIQNTLEELYYPWATDVERQKVLRIIIPADSSKNKSELFTEITGEIDKFINDAAIELNSIYLLVDKINFFHANALASEGWDSLIAMLVLALPELNWKFGEIILSDKENETDGHRISFMHSLQSLLHPNWNPLLDGSGLRNYIISISRKDSLGTYLPFRKELAIAIDDDPTYATLNAYTAYRFNYRAYDVSTNALAEFLVGKSGICTSKNDNAASAIETNLVLTFEDINLSFQDAENMKYSNRSNRNKHLAGLDNTHVTRSYITTGKKDNKDKSKHIIKKIFNKINKNKLEGTSENKLENDERKYYKPLAGIFGLWKECNFLDPIRMGEGFIWLSESINNSNISEHHSSPGSVKQIAQYLIKKCIKLIEDVKTLDEAIRGATLSISVLELLGDKEPTTISKAYELKQRFEVLAESMFGGVVFPFPLEPRFNEINNELDIIANWSGQEKRKLVRLNNELIIINYFITIYDDRNDLEKAELCRHKSRHLQNELWWKSQKNGFFKSITYPIKILRSYINFLLKSMGHIIGAILCWLILMVLFYCIFIDYNFKNSVLFTINSFFGGSFQSPSTEVSVTPTMEALGSFAIAWGFLHLGVLISHLYSTVSRK